MLMSHLPPPSDYAEAWSLDADVVFLNHGSFGACPRAVCEAQMMLRRRMEAEPVRFLLRELEEELDQARSQLAAFVGADPEGLAFVANATTGVNTALASFRLGAGDELLTTDHAYNACANALHTVAARTGASLTVAPVPFPLHSADQVVEAVSNRVTARTRVALLDHVTSQTGLVLPITELTAELESRGVAVVVDGAHAPGMIELDIAAINASFYAGNCHKWLCAPKGAGFLVVREDWRQQTRPLVISHGANAKLDGRSRFQAEFGWTGTQDPTAFLAVPVAIKLMDQLVEGGWRRLRAHNRELVLGGRQILCEALGVPPPCPESMIGSLASVQLPDGGSTPSSPPLYIDPLQDELMSAYQIEVPVMPWPAAPKRLLRISAQLYNREEQYRYLAQALCQLVGTVSNDR
jgi:isopenicillin-N epimerase